VPVERAAELDVQHGGDGVEFEGRAQVREGLGLDASAECGVIGAVLRGDGQPQGRTRGGSAQRGARGPDARVALELIGDGVGDRAGAQHRCPVAAVGFNGEAAHRPGAGLRGHPPECEQGDHGPGRRDGPPRPAMLRRVPGLREREQGCVGVAHDGSRSAQAAGQGGAAGEQQDQPDEHESGAADVRGVT